MKNADYVCKARLIKLRGNKCEICGLKEWLGKPITFDEHHKDENKKNDDINNRLILCPNCHRQYHLKSLKISKNKIGKRLSNKTKRKISETKKIRCNNKEYRQRLSESHKGENNPCYGRIGKMHPMFGKHHSKESNRKNSESHKGVRLSEETKRKISIARRKIFNEI